MYCRHNKNEIFNYDWGDSCNFKNLPKCFTWYKFYIIINDKALLSGRTCLTLLSGFFFFSATPKIVSKTKILEVENKSNLSTVPLNNLEPITNVRIWLANGKRIVQKFNISHRWVFCFDVCLLLFFFPPKFKFHFFFSVNSVFSKKKIFKMQN